MILSHLGVSDLVNVRTMCRQLSLAGLPILAKQLPVVYLHPTKSSMDAFEAICKHPAFSKHIREVAFVAFPYRPEPTESMSAFCEGFRVYPEFKAGMTRSAKRLERERRLEDRDFELSFRQYCQKYEEQETIPGTGRHLELLKWASFALPSLSTLTLVEAICNLGLNAENVLTTQTYQETYGDLQQKRSVHKWAFHRSGNDVWSGRKTTRLVQHWTKGILSSLPQQDTGFNCIRIGDFNSPINHHIMGIVNSSAEDIQGPGLSNLRVLEVHTHGPKLYQFFRNSPLSALSNLRSLIISCPPTSSISPALECTYPHLRTVRFEVNRSLDIREQAYNPYGLSSLRDFLLRHSSCLRELELIGSIPDRVVERLHIRTAAAPEYFEMLKVMKVQLHLEKAEISHGWNLHPAIFHRLLYVERECQEEWPEIPRTPVDDISIDGTIDFGPFVINPQVTDNQA